MKNSLKNLNLWQKKRNELPISDEPQSDWLQMQNLLDVHLPATTAVPKKVSGSSKGLKVVKALKAIKSSSILYISLAAAACIGLVIYATHVKQQHHPIKNLHKKHGAVNPKDSLSNTIVIDSLNLTDSTNNEKDTLSRLKPPVADQDMSVIAQKSASVIATNKNKPALNKNVVQGNVNSGKKTQALTGYTHQKNIPLPVTTGSQAKNINQLLLPGINTGTQPGAIPGPGISQPGRNTNVITQQVNNGKNTPLLISGIDSTQKPNNQPIIQPSSQPLLNSGLTTGQNTANTTRTNKPVTTRVTGSQKIKKLKTVTSGTATISVIDWGVLMGANSSGSFTAKDQNANIYGKLPVDIYLGLFATYHFNDKWAINTQIRALTPLNLKGSYTRANGGRIDTTDKTLEVTDSRKAYFVSVPIHIVYKINNNISVKGGPVINIPVKQVNGITNLQPEGIKRDSIYYPVVANQLKATKYDQKINLGMSGGVSLQYRRLILEATYFKSFSGYNVVSDFGSYKSNKGTVQITLGLQLNKLKL
jgi:flagellar basal body-associated protein FliL